MLESQDAPLIKCDNSVRIVKPTMSNQFSTYCLMFFANANCTIYGVH